MSTRKAVSFVCVTLVAAAIVTSAASAGQGTPTVPPVPVNDSQLQAVGRTIVVGGADVLPTTRTIPHWWGSTLDPVDGVKYGYNIAGADPIACSAVACDVTVETDITPIVVRVDGMTFSGSDVLGAALASPEFALNDYGSTPFATTAKLSRGPGGVLSQGDAGSSLQLEDAVMRAQFGRTGSSTYHLRLDPNVLPPVTIDVPDGEGLLLQTSHGVVFPAVDIQWWNAQIHNLLTTADPTHLALYLTDNVQTYLGNRKSFQLDASGFHGATRSSTNGNAPVQTFAWATWLSPGYFGTDGGFGWALQDMNVLNHEIGEWADDPFGTNLVQAWPFVPGLSQYGCSSVLETGDAPGGNGFAMGTNTFRQGPNPDGTQTADGYYHPQDLLTLPWFLRLAPNTMSEPTQTPSAYVGRYSFMGNLDRSPGFDGPAPQC
jgi:hypothetical protein